MSFSTDNHCCELEVFASCAHCGTGAIYVPEVGPMGDEFHKTISKTCIGSCPECWCRGCHDGQDFPQGRIYELDDGNPCGSWLAFEELQRAERKRRELAPMPGQVALEISA